MINQSYYDGAINIWLTHSWEYYNLYFLIIYSHHIIFLFSRFKKKIYRNGLSACSQVAIRIFSQHSKPTFHVWSSFFHRTDEMLTTKIRRQLPGLWIHRKVFATKLFGRPCTRSFEMGENIIWCLNCNVIICIV